MMPRVPPNAARLINPRFRDSPDTRVLLHVRSNATCHRPLCLFHTLAFFNLKRSFQLFAALRFRASVRLLGGFSVLKHGSILFIPVFCAFSALASILSDYSLHGDCHSDAFVCGEEIQIETQKKVHEQTFNHSSHNNRQCHTCRIGGRWKI